MTWVRLDDALPRHPKIVALPVATRWAFIEALCYCGSYLTDGYLPAGVINQRDAQSLLAAGLLDPRAEGGFLVHDFLVYNPTRSDVEGSREQAAERMRDVRANVHPNNGRSASNPVPVPQPREPRARYSRAFEAFWREYPRKVGKRTAATAYDRAATRCSDADILAGARRLAADPNLPESRFVPHPTTWLNRDGWEDDMLPARSNGRSNLRALADGLEAQGL